jgi:hypothetical protein
MFSASFGYISVVGTVVSFHSKLFALNPYGENVGVTDFGTRDPIPSQSYRPSPTLLLYEARMHRSLMVLGQRTHLQGSHSSLNT